MRVVLNVTKENPANMSYRMQSPEHVIAEIYERPAFNIARSPTPRMNSATRVIGEDGMNGALLNQARQIEQAVARLSDDDLPAYIIDLGQIERNFRILKSYFPEYPMHYAVKANPDVEILRTLLSSGANFEAASLGEVDRLLSIGTPPQQIAYGNPCKSTRNICDLLDRGIRKFVIENLADLQRLLEKSSDVRIALRLNLTELRENHIDYGATRSAISEMMRAQPSLLTNVKGLTYYGSHTIGLSACERVIEEHMPWIEFINLGGGFLYEGLAHELRLGKSMGSFDFFTRLLAQFKKRTSVDFILEPGAVLVKNACHAVAQVQYVNDTNRELLYYHIDLGPTLGLRKPVSRILVYGDSGESSPSALIVDSTCAKKFVARLSEHAKLEEGDIIILPEVGMYSLPYICDFHLLRKPRFIYLRDTPSIET